jgi:hypothetical protein
MANFDASDETTASRLRGITPARRHFSRLREYQELPHFSTISCSASASADIFACRRG